MQTRRNFIMGLLWRGALVYLAFKVGQTYGCYQELKEDVVRDYTTFEHVIENETNKIKDLYHDYKSYVERVQKKEEN
jgi:hypothetical protein